MIIDTHAHLQSPKYKDQDISTIIEEANSNGVELIIVNGYDVRTSIEAIELAEKFECVYATVGIHPSETKDIGNQELLQIEELLNHPKVVALGEIGLDYYWDKSFKDHMQEIFRKQIRLAKKYRLPITVHNREATNDIYNIIKEEDITDIKGVMHCFSSSYEMALKFIDLGMFISFAGPVTFKNAKTAKEVAKRVDLDKILVETDCPYLTPHPFRGKINYPKYVKLVSEEIAEQKSISVEEVEEATTKNAKNIFYKIPS